jgi:hypothetical protein
MAALRARPVGPLHRGLLRQRWIGSIFLDQVFEIAPPAGFEPAHTAPEAAALYRADQRKRVGGGRCRACLGGGLTEPRRILWSATVFVAWEECEMTAAQRGDGAEVSFVERQQARGPEPLRQDHD